jgi:hypothetical protein
MSDYDMILKRVNNLAKSAEALQRITSGTHPLRLHYCLYIKVADHEADHEVELFKTK